MVDDEGQLAEALTGYYQQLTKTINGFVEQYDRMPYRTASDKRELQKMNRRIEDYWQQLDACVVVARRGGLTLPTVVIKHQGDRSRALWKNRKPILEPAGKETGVFLA